MSDKKCLMCKKNLLKKDYPGLTFDGFEKRIFCFKACHVKYNHGENAGYYKNGHTIRNGYLVENKRNKYVHRIIMEEIIGRALDRKEVVHHINHNRLDNAPQNLFLVSLGEHTSIHVKDRPRIKNGRFCCA